MGNEALNNHETVRNIQIAIEKAAEIIASGPGANPFEVFPNPADKDRRADVVWGAELSEEQQEAFRGVMAEVGIGREHNIGPKEAGLQDDGYVALFEGGQPHKMIAQLNIIDSPENQEQPYWIVVTGDTGREIKGAERSGAAKLLGISEEEVGATEYDLARQVVEAREGFAPRETEREVLQGEGFSYTDIGTLNGHVVTLMAIDRQPNEDGSFRRLGNVEKMKIVSGGNLPPYDGKWTVGFVTSATYQPSNVIATAKVAQETGADIRVCSYGTHELAQVKGEEPAVPSIAQLGAEAYKTAQLLQRYQAEQR